MQADAVWCVSHNQTDTVFINKFRVFFFFFFFFFFYKFDNNLSPFNNTNPVEILWLVLLYDKDDDGTIIEAYYVIIFGVADGHTDPKRLVAQTRDGRDVWYTVIQSGRR